MINRPPTRIELKLEDDFIEYQQMEELRRKNFEKALQIQSPNIKEPFELGPDDFNSNSYNNQFSPFNNKLRGNVNRNQQIRSDDISVSKSNTSDIAMD